MTPADRFRMMKWVKVSDGRLVLFGDRPDFVGVPGEDSTQQKRSSIISRMYRYIDKRIQKICGEV